MPEQRDNTAKLAKALWSEEGSRHEPAQFQSRFDAIDSAAEGIATLWQPGGAANDYLRLQPNSITIPPELAPNLLASRMVDARIVGLKLLVRTSHDFSVSADWICRALESQKLSELYGGIFELHNLLRRVQTAEDLPAVKLRDAVEKLRPSRDSYVRTQSEELLQRLTEL